MRTTFAKYEGAGNDFILIDNREGIFTPDAETIARLCDRHFGIGADGLMTLSRSAEMDCSMRYYNADGSEGEMCGNGARCFSLFAEHLGIGGETKYFDAADGLHTARIRRTKGLAGQIEVGMIAVREIRSGAGWWFLNTGVPHYVEFTEALDAVDVCGAARNPLRHGPLPAGHERQFRTGGGRRPYPGTNLRAWRRERDPRLRHGGYGSGHRDQLRFPARYGAFRHHGSRRPSFGTVFA